MPLADCGKVFQEIRSRCSGAFPRKSEVILRTSDAVGMALDHDVDFGVIAEYLADRIEDQEGPGHQRCFDRGRRPWRRVVSRATGRRSSRR